MGRQSIEGSPSELQKSSPTNGKNRISGFVSVHLSSFNAILLETTSRLSISEYVPPGVAAATRADRRVRDTSTWAMASLVRTCEIACNTAVFPVLTGDYQPNTRQNSSWQSERSRRRTRVSCSCRPWRPTGRRRSTTCKSPGCTSRRFDHNADHCYLVNNGDNTERGIRAFPRTQRGVSHSVSRFHKGEPCAARLRPSCRGGGSS